MSFDVGKMRIITKILSIKFQVSRWVLGKDFVLALQQEFIQGLHWRIYREIIRERIAWILLTREDYINEFAKEVSTRSFLRIFPKVFTQRNFPKSFTQSVYSIEFSWSIYAKCSLEGVYPMALHGWITRVNYTNTTSLVRWILECFPQDEYKNLSPSAFPKVNTWKRKVLRNKLNKNNVMTIGNWDIP